jgi:hypothetical protein
MLRCKSRGDLAHGSRGTNIQIWTANMSDIFSCIFCHIPSYFKFSTLIKHFFMEIYVMTPVIIFSQQCMKLHFHSKRQKYVILSIPLYSTWLIWHPSCQMKFPARVKLTEPRVYYTRIVILWHIIEITDSIDLYFLFQCVNVGGYILSLSRRLNLSKARYVKTILMIVQHGEVQLH